MKKGFRPPPPIFSSSPERGCFICHHKCLIVTLTMNPAVDRTIAVDRLAFEDRTYILSSKESPGGRGINAASVIHSFGGQTMAILPAGGERGERFEGYMEGCGFPVVTVPIRNDIRLNFT